MCGMIAHGGVDRGMHPALGRQDRADMAYHEHGAYHHDAFGWERPRCHGVESSVALRVVER